MKKLLLLISSLTIVVNIEASHTLARDTYAIIALYHTEKIDPQYVDTETEITSESEESETTKGQTEETSNKEPQPQDIFSLINSGIQWIQSRLQIIEDVFIVSDTEESESGSESEQESKEILAYTDVDAFIIKADIKILTLIQYVKMLNSSYKACALLAPPGSSHFSYQKKNLFTEEKLQAFEDHIREEKEDLKLHHLRNKGLQKFILSFKEVNAFMHYKPLNSPSYKPEEDLIGLTVKNLIKKEKKGCAVKFSPYRNSLNQVKLEELNPAPLKIYEPNHNYILYSTLLALPFLLILIFILKKKRKKRRS